MKLNDRPFNAIEKVENNLDNRIMMSLAFVVVKTVFIHVSVHLLSIRHELQLGNEKLQLNF